jgi:hypothetical protein
MESPWGSNLVKNRRSDDVCLRGCLEQLLYELLEPRAGLRLRQEEKRVFLHIAARIAQPGSSTYVADWQVCEWCDVVFSWAHKNARRCADCQRARLPKLRPASAGGVHIGAYGDPADGQIVYLGICRSCGRQYNSTDPRRELCVDCGSSRGRINRHRGVDPRSSQG